MRCDDKWAERKGEKNRAEQRGEEGTGPERKRDSLVNVTFTPSPALRRTVDRANAKMLFIIYANII